MTTHQHGRAWKFMCDPMYTHTSSSPRVVVSHMPSSPLPSSPLPHQNHSAASLLTRHPVVCGLLPADDTQSCYVAPAARRS